MGCGPPPWPRINSIKWSMLWIDCLGHHSMVGCIYLYGPSIPSSFPLPFCTCPHRKLGLGDLIFVQCHSCMNHHPKTPGSQTKPSARVEMRTGNCECQILFPPSTSLGDGPVVKNGALPFGDRASDDKLWKSHPSALSDKRLGLFLSEKLLSLLCNQKLTSIFCVVTFADLGRFYSLFFLLFLRMASGLIKYQTHWQSQLDNDFSSWVVLFGLPPSLGWFFSFG